MAKVKLVDEVMVTADPPMTRKDATRAVAAVTSAIARIVERGDRTLIRGFGAFEMRERKGRTGTLQGRQVEHAAKRYLHFSDRRA